MFFLGTVTAVAQGDVCSAAVSVNAGIHTSDGPSTGNGASTVGTHSDWYSFTPICDGVMSVGSCNGGVDTRLYIHSGVCGSLNQVGFADDNCPTGTGSNFASEVVNLSVTGGTTYYIEWSDFWSTQGHDWFLDFTVAGGVTSSISPGINNAFVAWLPVGLEPGWDVQYGPSGFQLGSGTVLNEDSLGSDFTLEITGLLPETTYDYYIAIEGTPCYVGPITFTTLPLCPTPTGITINSLATSIIMNWTPGGGTPTPSWDLQYGPVGLPIGDPGMIFDNNITTQAHNAQNLTSCTNLHMYVREICDANSTPPLTSLWVGPIDIGTVCTCPEPSALGASPDPLDPFKYILDWTPGGGETMWNVQWGPTGFVFGTGTTVSASSNPFTVQGVTPNSTLDYYVQADCGGGDESFWVGPFSFTTNEFCPMPTGLGANTITTISANIFWNVSGTTTNYTIEYGESGFTLGTGLNYSIGSANANLTGLTPDTEYCYYVQSNCGATPDSSSLWAGPYCFKTVAACPAPTNLSILNITNTAATLNWQPGAGETMWDVVWGFPGFDPDINIGDVGGPQDGGTSNTTSDIYAQGLNAAAPYQYYVRAVCGGLDGNSVWVGPFDFTTLLANDLACGAIELLVDGNVNIHTNVGATVNGENAIRPPLTNNLGVHATDATWWQDTWIQPNGVDNPVWFKFKTPASGKVEISTVNDITLAEETMAEIAVYEVGNCNIISNFSLLGANSFDNLESIDQNFTGNFRTDQTAIAGSRVLLCDLNPGQFYYIMVDNVNDGNEARFDPGTFGISITDIPSPDAGDGLTVDFCGNGSPFDLFTSIDNYSTNTGTWYNNTTQIADSIVSFPPGAGVYNFQYIINNACGTDTSMSTVNVVQPSSAGLDGYYSTCNTKDVYLMNHVQGQAQFGGAWSDANGQYSVANGIFETYGLPYGTYNFYYVVQGNGICPADTSVVSINLNDNCLGIEETTVSSLEMFPNPVNDILTIANLSITGSAQIVLYDAQGKMVISEDISNHSGNYTLDMTQLEAGLYVLEVNSETVNEKARVVKN